MSKRESCPVCGGSIRDCETCWEEGRQAGLEEAAIENCYWCRAGHAIHEKKHFVKDGLEPKGSKGRSVVCWGNDIRALKGSKEKKG